VITYSDIKRYDNVEFGNYLSKPGYSHSYLKREVNGILPGLDITENISLGKMVDTIITEPHNVNIQDELYEPGKSIVEQIRATFGDLIKRFEMQVSYVGVANYNCWAMRVKGRLDFLLPGHAVIDLKITKTKSKQIPALIDYMGYKNQLWHYCRLAGVTKGYLMIYCQPERKTYLYVVDVSEPVNAFWAEKIEKFGYPVAA
jgi:hypothetical protein